MDTLLAAPKPHSLLDKSLCHCHQLSKGNLLHCSSTTHAYICTAKGHHSRNIYANERSRAAWGEWHKLKPQLW